MNVISRELATNHHQVFVQCLIPEPEDSAKVINSVIPEPEASAKIK